MPKKKEEEVLIDSEVVVEPEVKATKEKSEEYTKFMKFIQSYKAQSPVKYELKKEALFKKLESLE